MGLFDKLLGKFSAKQTIDNTIKDPFEDQTIKKYFEIIYGMGNSLVLIDEEQVKDNERAKNYVEYFLNGPCDINKLEKSLELYNLSRAAFPKDEIAKIASNYSKSLSKSTTYYLEHHKATKMFCQKDIDDATKQFEGIIDVVNDNLDYILFSKGLKKINHNRFVKDIVIGNSFCDGSPIIRELVAEYLIDTLVGRINSDTYNYVPDVALVVAKALHFEKYGNNREGYISVTDDEYRNLVLNVYCYKKSIENHPFDKEVYIQKYVDGIKKGYVFHNVYSSYWQYRRDYERGFPLESPDEYFSDAACHFVWKKIAQKRVWLNENEENISDSLNVNDVFDIIIAYIQTPDEDMRIRHEEILAKREEEREREKIKSQCKACAFCDICQLPDRNLNCSGFVPK